MSGTSGYYRHVCGVALVESTLEPLYYQILKGIGWRDNLPVIALALCIPQNYRLISVALLFFLYY
jgi:hypothetical protein